MNTNTSQSPPDETHSEEKQSLIGQDPDQWEESLKDKVCQGLGVGGKGEGFYGARENQDDGGRCEDGWVGEGGGWEGGRGKKGELHQDGLDHDAHVAKEDDHGGEWE